MRLDWLTAALRDLEEAAEWSPKQAEAVFLTMERMAQRGFSLGKATDRPGVRYWPVPPWGVFYSVRGGALTVVQVVDTRRLLEAP